ncbi:LysR substrate binding domain protein [compost metagenome]
MPDHQLIHYVRQLGARSPGFEYEQDGATRYRTMAGVITVNSTEAYESACLAGLGIIQAPAAGLREYLERGELVSVLEAYSAPPMPVSLLYAGQLHVPQRVRAFMDWLAQLLQAQLDPVAGGR